MAKFIILVGLSVQMRGSTAMANPAFFQVTSSYEGLEIYRIRYVSSKFDGLSSVDIPRSQFGEFRSDLLLYCNKLWFDVSGWRRKKCIRLLNEAVDELTFLLNADQFKIWQVENIRLASALSGYLNRISKNTEICIRRLGRDG
jgi:hypothetical protein